MNDQSWYTTIEWDGRSDYIIIMGSQKSSKGYKTKQNNNYVYIQGRFNHSKNVKWISGHACMLKLKVPKILMR